MTEGIKITDYFIPVAGSDEKIKQLIMNYIVKCNIPSEYIESELSDLFTGWKEDGCLPISVVLNNEIKFNGEYCGVING